ncbi:MAG: trimethylamine methyltransferase family protein [Promethearchaeati archaeon SRVP18_Atabeyarchaeia-1]
MTSSKPSIKILPREAIEEIYENALYVLSATGVIFKSKRAVETLGRAGADADVPTGVVKFPRDLVKNSVESCPESFKLHYRDGSRELLVGGDNVYFNPGSAALNLLDARTNASRKPVTKDFVEFIKVAEELPNIHAQSTALVCSDIPQEIADRYRLYLVLKHSVKPIITGTFTLDGTLAMKNMLSLAVGGDKNLASRPTAIFDCCPSPPLLFSEITSESLIDCAKYSIPVELISMPLMGATGPITIAGSLVQHTAETLSGIVLAQSVKKGCPVVYGGSPSAFDMHYGTTPMGASETILIDLAYAEIGKWLGLPTHTYLGMSDSKVVDAQAGFESGASAVLGALAGINIISGPGMLEFENCQSIEKLVVDNEICGMALRVARGFEVNSETMALEDLRSRGKNGSFISLPSTLRLFRKEHYIPSEVVDRANRSQWEEKGSKDIIKRAKEQAQAILEKSKAKKAVSEALEKDLGKSMLSELKKFGVNKIPAN